MRQERVKDFIEKLIRAISEKKNINEIEIFLVDSLNENNYHPEEIKEAFDILSKLIKNPDPYKTPLRILSLEEKAHLTYDAQRYLLGKYYEKELQRDDFESILNFICNQNVVFDMKDLMQLLGRSNIKQTVH